MALLAGREMCRAVRAGLVDNQWQVRMMSSKSRLLAGVLDDVTTPSCHGRPRRRSSRRHHLPRTSSLTVAAQAEVLTSQSMHAYSCVQRAHVYQRTIHYLLWGIPPRRRGLRSSPVSRVVRRRKTKQLKDRGREPQLTCSRTAEEGRANEPQGIAALAVVERHEGQYHHYYTHGWRLRLSSLTTERRGDSLQNQRLLALCHNKEEPKAVKALSLDITVV